VAQGELIPAEEESFNHTARVCRVGPDGKLYISLGQPYNVQPVEKVEMYDEIGIGGIIRINTDGTGREVFTRGVRNSVGHDFNPANGDLWFTDNQVDGMGDDIPPGELNRQTAAGQHFGFPWTNSRVEIPDFKDVPRPEGVEFIEPQLELTAHAADLGMSFYGATPSRRSTTAASSGRSTARGTGPRRGRARDVHSARRERRRAGTEVFADGWLNEETGEYRGRPMDIAFLPDGSMLGPTTSPARSGASPTTRREPNEARSFRPRRAHARRGRLAEAADRRSCGRPQLANQCRTCHGLDGYAQIPIAPHIGGEPEGYIEAQLTAFRDRGRASTR
jgi:glucose/arabinose dehydrogenase/cytochrome c553